MSDVWEGVSQAWETNAQFIDEHLARPTGRMLEIARVGPGNSVIDLACGPGGAGLAAAELVGANGKVVLADSAPGMVAASAHRSVALANVSTMLCEQDEIPVTDGTFDAVVIRHGLMFAEDRIAAIREAMRVLAPGGRYAAMTWDSRAKNPWLGLPADAVGEELGVPFPPPGVGPFALEDPAALKSLLDQSGLTEVTVESVAAPMTIGSLDAWWDLVLQIAGPLTVVIDGMPAEAQESIRARALEMAESVAEKTTDEIKLAGSVLIASGRRA